MIETLKNKKRNPGYLRHTAAASKYKNHNQLKLD